MLHTALQTVTIAVVAGVASTLLGRRLRIPPILFFLLLGVFLGPLGLGWVRPESLGNGLVVLVEIMVAVILFEGGLSLSTHSFRKAGAAIRRILLISLPLTGLGAAVLGRLILDLAWPKALFFGALIVVTGPTVVGALLKAVSLSPSLRSLLDWESIWGDVLGVLLSGVALKFILSGSGHGPERIGFLFLERLLLGLFVGVLAGEILRRWVFPFVMRLQEPALPGVTAFAAALGIFHVSNLLSEHSGPLAAAAAGLVLSIGKTSAIEDVRHFKEQISIVLIGSIFVLLSSTIDPFAVAAHWPGMLVVALILGALVRPASVLVALAGTPLPWRERLYAGIVGPRGIVALATVAYADILLKGDPVMPIITNLTFVIIFLSGAFATLVSRPLAALLDVELPSSGLGILIVGIHPLSSQIAQFASQRIPVAFLDTNPSTCSLAQGWGHQTVCADVLNIHVYEEALEQGYGRLLAISNDDALNQLVAQAAAVQLGPHRVFRAKADAAGDPLLMETPHPPRQAFGSGFSVREALDELKQGRATLEVLSVDGKVADHVTPLLIFTEDGKGVEIVENREGIRGSALCLVRKPPRPDDRQAF
ncbi:NhaP-type Na+/H+ or K+/H+ antiporter [Desulfacinum hydrothermale DSM 13146]|uniref:NhaP-type Na+/H+ or K+/H+ antiporter n=1 Tax=Desulfacinum hydrothermale DSM 13146 TaxID=1121390 RepID=A0A1W1WXD1_9BACT|nr:cation:proton antiporter [Desulfacinum hydrothermale]SMC16240.1 NhaP-type Na+/H+ or K+/H+ antiporter [Desulfacinum hydrothermale DSM 13146]